MPSTASSFTIVGHFAGRSPDVKAAYTAILRAARKLGRVREEPKKTSIHLVRDSAFAGIATRQTALILTLKSDRDIASPRIAKHQRASANRWHLDVRLEKPEDVDAELVQWLRQAYELGTRHSLYMGIGRHILYHYD